jgi:O-antigen ligase
MISIVSTYGQGNLTTVSQPMSKWLRLCAIALTGVAIVSSALHFWPFDSSKAWQMLCLPNSAVLMWILILTVYFFLKRGQGTDTSLLPHLSVFAYLAVNVLSVAFAANSVRAISFAGKLTLMFIGGYVLFSSAIFSTKSLRIIYGLATTATLISVAYCLLARFGFGSNNFGFFDNLYKYGTYTGILAPLCTSYLFMSSRFSKQLLAAILLIGTLISSGSLGAVIAITVGMTAFAVVIKRWLFRICVVGCLLCGVSLIILLDTNPAIVPLGDDIKLAEEDGINLKQRYIEWQAELNLLEERTITGTAAGCINDYRSNFYYRLPKLNTLKAFDQNGWLAVGAETGILGLVCFCWIIVYYSKLAYSQVTTANRIESATVNRVAVANFIGLIAACAANLISSVHYNGILIVFVLILVLISRTNLIFGQK